MPDLPVLNRHPRRLEYEEVERLWLRAPGFHGLLHLNRRRQMFGGAEPTRRSNRAAPSPGPPRQSRPGSSPLDRILRRGQSTTTSTVQRSHCVDEQVPAVQ